MSDSADRPGVPPRRSASAEAFAVRWAEEHPEEDVVDHPPPAVPPEPEDGVPNRHSASAEAAALRLRERDGDTDPDDGS
jgi:hypothetical protein